MAYNRRRPFSRIDRGTPRAGAAAIAATGHEPVTISGRNLAFPAVAPPACPPRPLVLGTSTVDLARQAVSRDGQETRLRPRTADVLSYLVAHAGTVVTNQALLAAVWGGVAVTDDSLVQCLVEVRRALGPDQDVVRTIRGRGYLLDLPAGERPAAVTAAAPVPAPAAPPDTGAPRRWPFAAVTALAGAAVLAFVAGLGERVTPVAAVGPSETLNDGARQAVTAGLLLSSPRAQVDQQRARQLFERGIALDLRAMWLPDCS